MLPSKKPKTTHHTSMARRTPPVMFAWIAYILMFSSAVIILGAMSASQRFCGRSSANALTVSAAGGYLSPIPCDKLYSLTWFVTWYQFAMAIVVPVVLGMGAVHTWRYGVVGLLVPITYLLMSTANTFMIQKLNLPSNKSASRTMLAGCIIGAVANYVLIILLGVRDEKVHD